MWRKCGEKDLMMNYFCLNSHSKTKNFGKPTAGKQALNDSCPWLLAGDPSLAGLPVKILIGFLIRRYTWIFQRSIKIRKKTTNNRIKFLPVFWFLTISQQI